MKHVIGLSGGKDSTALALRLAEVEPRDYEYICTPTGNELPELFAHLDNLERLLGKPIKRLGPGYDLFQLIGKQGMIPNFRARFCTRILKIEPTIEYMESLPEGSTLYVGLRADEPAREGIFGEDIKIRFPMREWNWTIDDVWSYLRQRGVSVPKRTDCAVCFYQRLGEWWNLWKHNPAHWEHGELIEDIVGATFRSPSRDAWPASLAELAKAFESGKIPKGADLDYRPHVAEGDACRVCSL